MSDILEDAIGETEYAISCGEESSLDLSKEYYDESSAEFLMQAEIRFSTRGLFEVYKDEIDFEKKVDSEQKIRAFELMKRARILFGSHAFSNVLDGRIAGMVRYSLRNNIRVPAEFHDDYRYFTFHPWNHPRIDYNTPAEYLAKRKFRRIPPDWLSISVGWFV